MIGAALVSDGPEWQSVVDGEPYLAGLLTPADMQALEGARQAAAADLVSRNSLAALTPRAALADMRAVALGQAGASWMRGLAMWCLLGALVVAGVRW